MLVVQYGAVGVIAISVTLLFPFHCTRLFHLRVYVTNNDRVVSHSCNGVQEDMYWASLLTREALLTPIFILSSPTSTYCGTAVLLYTTVLTISSAWALVERAKEGWAP